MDKNALIVVTSNDQLGSSGKTGWYLSEVSHVYYPLVEAGFNVNFASPRGGIAPVEEKSLDLNDELNRRFVDEKEITTGIHTLAASEVDPADYSVIHFAGGHGTMWDLPENEDLQELAVKVYEQGGIVAAVCHGPSALVNAVLSSGNFLVEGKEVNSFTDDEEREVGKDDVVPFLLESKLRERGANFKKAENWGNKVVVSERLITGQNPQSALSLGKAIVEEFKKFDQSERFSGPLPDEMR